MADTTYYISDQGSDTSPYDTMLKGANAKASAEALATDGNNTFFYASDHAEDINASFGLKAGVSGAPNKHISVNRSTEIEETMVVGGGHLGVLVTTYEFYLFSHVINRGLNILVADDLTWNVDKVRGHIIEKGQLTVTDDFVLDEGTNEVYVEFRNVDYLQRTAGTMALSRCVFNWFGGTFSFIVSGAINTQLFSLSITEGVTIYVEGVDFQDLDAGDYLVSNPRERAIVKFVGCKVPSAMAGLMTGTIIEPQVKVNFLNVSSEDTQINIAAYRYQGLVTDDDSIYTGSTQKSLEFDANSNVEEGLDGLTYTLCRGYSTANPTFEVELVADEATALTDNDIWLEIYGPDDTTGALSLITKTRASDINNPTTLTSSSASWTGAGGFTNEQKRKITKSLTGYQAGVYRIDVVVAKDIVAYADFDVSVS